MSRGSSLVECIVALLVTSSAACAAISTLRTCSTLQHHLNAGQRLSEIAQAVDGIQGAEPTYTADHLEDAIQAISQRIARNRVRCTLDDQASTLHCEAEQLTRSVPFFLLRWGRDELH